MSREQATTRDSETLAEGNIRAGRAGRAAAFLQNDLVMDFVACLPLASGLTMALTTVTVLDKGLWKILILTAASLALIALMRTRWWLAPASAGVLLAGTVFYNLVVRDPQSQSEYWIGFLRWAWRGASTDGLYANNGGLLLLEAALAFVVSFAVFVIVRRVFAFPLALGITATVMIWTYARGRADLSVALCLASAGLIILLPRVYAGYVRRNSDGSQSRGSMQLVAVPAALLALLLSLALIPEDTSDWRSYGLSNLASDMGRLLRGPFQTYPADSSNFSMDMVNFQPDGSRLGGPVTLGNKRVAIVNTEQPVLLRGSVLDYYTGENWWMGAPDGDFRYASLFWRRYRREAYDLGRPAGNTEQRLFSDLTRKADIALYYTDNRFSTLFTAGRVHDVAFADRKLKAEPYFNARGELYLHQPIQKSTRVTINTTTWQPRTPAFDDGFLRLEQLTVSAPDQNYDFIFKRYTQLPDTLPGIVRATADEITSGLESPYEKARAIGVWLMDNCDYTLNPEPVPAGTDFVANFLETREGYCTYYASAMAVMARCAGLPSRYVTGFGLESASHSDGNYQATEKTAHAWTEIYFRSIGWMEFDPLAWDAENPLNADVQTDQNSNPNQSPAVSSGDSGNASDGSLIPGEFIAGEMLSAPMLAVTALGAITLYVLLRLAMRAVMTRKIRAFRLNRVLRRFPDMPSRLDYYYADIIKQLKLLGLEPLPGETLKTFPARADRFVKIEEGTLVRIAEARMRLHFAGVTPTLDDVEAAFRYHQGLEPRVMERLGRTAYFFRRAIR